MGFLQQFHLIIKYKKGDHNKIADLLSRSRITTINTFIVLQQSSLAYDNYIEQYAKDEDFKDVYEYLMHGTQIEELNYHVHDQLLYHLGKICIPQSERVHVIRESHTSLISGYFGVGKTVARLQRYCYWPHMNATSSKYVKGCIMCATSKPGNRKLGLYTQLLVPSHPWESVSMEFMEGLPMSRKVMITCMWLRIDLLRCEF